MDEFARLSRPNQPGVNVDPNTKEPLQDGFNYPTFRLLNKKTRITLSPDYINYDQSFSYCALSVANSKGWFAAMQHDNGSFSVILSPLSDLRKAIKDANTDGSSLTPQRILSFRTSEPNIVRFAANDTRLVIGFKSGQLVVYDTALILTPGTDDNNFLHVLETSSSPPIQILPNPSNDPSLAELLAVVRADGTVQMLNTSLESKGGWAASGSDSVPVAVAWSPKGKQLAIGLQLGDILCFSPTNMSLPQKHIPPTANGTLASLNWLAPGHTFRTSYAVPESDPAHHIVHVEARSTSASCTKLEHSFQVPDRTKQNAFVLALPKWDDTDDNKLLVIVGDVSCTDMEVLGNEGIQWYQQSQENPLSIPLDKNSDETVLMSLEADLTDVEAGFPVIYAYLNDGTVQAWHVEHSKPYAGMITPGTAVIQSSVPAATSSTFSQSGFSQPAATHAFGQTQPTSTFGQASQTSAFGQPQQPSAFGQPSTFGQQSSAPAFGQSSFGKPASTPAFGQPSFTQSSNSSSAFSAFTSNKPSSFGTGSFGSATLDTSSTASTPSPTMPDESMSDSGPTFGGLSLGGDSDTNDKPKSAFGSGIFGSSAPLPSDQTSSSSTLSGESFIKPASGFGAFGNSSGGFGSFGNKSGEQPSAFSGGAFSAKPNNTSTFGSVTPSTQSTSGFGQSGFGQPAFGKPAFGQSSFGQSAFGQTGFGSAKPASTASTSGGFSAFSGAPSAFGSGTSKPVEQSNTSGGFASFASGTSAFSTAAPVAKSALSGSGNTETSAFGKSTEATSTPSASAFSSFASNGPSVFGAPASSPEARSAFGSSPAFVPKDSTPQQSPSPSPPPSTPPPANKSPSTPTMAPSTGAFSNLKTSTFKPDSGFGAFGGVMSNDSPFMKAAQNKTSPASALALSSPSTPSSSPSPASTAPTFGAPSKLGSSTPTFGSPSKIGFGSATASPAFGATSKLGFGFGMPSPSPPASGSEASSQKPSATTANAFSAFTGTASPFGQLGGAAKSFGDLLKEKKGEEGNKEVQKVIKEAPKEESDKSTPTVSSASAVKEEESTPKSTLSVLSEPKETAVSSSSREDKKTPPPVFSAPPKDQASKSDSETKVKAEPPLTPPLDKVFSLKGKGKEDEPEPTKITAQPSSESVSSQASSFVDVSKEEAESSEGPEDSSGEGDDESEHGEGSEGSFLSEHYESEEESEEHEEGEGEEGEEGEEGGEGEEVEEESVSEPRSPSPERIPLPPSRSRSNTPQQEAPAIKVSSESPASSDLSSDEESDSSRLSTIREESTTPPGSPTKPIVAPTPVVASAPQPSSTLSGVRPSTRPTRSSPLASAPLSLSGGEDQDEDGNQTPKNAPIEIKPIQHKPRPASPKPPFGTFPVKPTSEDVKTPATKRPKTPPLSAFGFGGPPSTETSTAQSPLSSGKSAPLLSTPLTVFSSTSPSSSPSPFGNPLGLKPFGSPSTPPGTTPPTQANVGLAEDASASGPLSVSRGTSSSAPATPFTPSSMPTSFAKPFAPSPSFFGNPAAPLSAPSILATPTAMPPTPTISPATIGSPLMNAGALASSEQPRMPGFNLPPGKLPAGFSANVPAALGTSPTMGKPAMQAPATPTSSGIAGMPGVPPGFGTVGAPTNLLQQYQEGMQQDCVVLCISMAKELDELRQLAERAAVKREHLSRSAGGSRKKEDLGDSSKWGLVDMMHFGQVMKTFEKDIEEMKERREDLRRALSALDKEMIKANARREEIARFNKAKSDNEFAKMLKTRTLGPEHQENQTQLRRNIRAVDTRVTQLEDQLKAYKKRLSEINSGKPAFRAPSLDVINRTYRNIDIAIQKQMDDVSYLTKRVSKLNLSVSASPSSSRSSPFTPNGRHESPSRSNFQNGHLSKRPWNITPDVAVTTAAALNAERSAHKLKTVLLKARKEPLLNEQAKEARKPPVAFNMSGMNRLSDTPVASGSGTGIQFNTPFNLDANYLSSDIDWDDFPEDNFHVATPIAAARRGGAQKKSHGIKKNTPSPGHAQTSPVVHAPASAGTNVFGSPLAPTTKPPLPSSPPPPKFNWGPLPNNASKPSLLDEKGKGKESGDKPGLSSGSGPSTGSGKSVPIPSGFVSFSSFKPKSTPPATPPSASPTPPPLFGTPATPTPTENSGAPPPLFDGSSNLLRKPTSPGTLPGNAGSPSLLFGGGAGSGSGGLWKPATGNSKPPDLGGSWVADGFK